MNLLLVLSRLTIEHGESRGHNAVDAAVVSDRPPSRPRVARSGPCVGCTPTACYGGPAGGTQSAVERDALAVTRG
jgi:hypothetical protein